MKQSEDAREELRERLEKEAEARLSAVRQEMGEAIEAAKKAGEETNALYAKEYRARKSIHNRQEGENRGGECVDGLMDVARSWSPLGLFVGGRRS